MSKREPLRNSLLKQGLFMGISTTMTRLYTEVPLKKLLLPAQNMVTSLKEQAAI